MPFGDFVNQIPPIGFLIVHIVLFAAGSYFARRSFGAGATTLGWAFSLFALAEIVYMTYHLDWTVFLFAHTISEVLDLSEHSFASAASGASVSPGEHAAHLVVLIGMVLGLAGVIADGVRHSGRPDRLKGSARHAVR